MSCLHPGGAYYNFMITLFLFDHCQIITLFETLLLPYYYLIIIVIITLLVTLLLPYLSLLLPYF